MNELFVFVDGGARGNPGPSAVGVYIVDKNKVEIKKIGKKIGNATNNVAEYQAALEALTWIAENVKDDTYSKINFYMDSQLVCSQITGLYKVKNSNLRDLLFSVRTQEARIKTPIFYNLIPREKNQEADLLVNKALDNIL
jgi:ribonuclease HI